MTTKGKDNEIIYKGNWQFGDTIRQELAGPIGNGEVWYSNGDYFKGEFHLSYAHIYGSAYAADGRYSFADGSYIERAWINTSENLKPEFWGLCGVFRIRHPEGPDSVAMFCGGKRYGFELFLDEKNPHVKEWYDDVEISSSSDRETMKDAVVVVDYQLDETSRVDCTYLELTLKSQDKLYRVSQNGGLYAGNQYGNYYYEPHTEGSIILPNGDIIDHWGRSVQLFQPYDGYLTYHNADTQQYRSEQWERGFLKKSEPWERDILTAKSVEIPDPFGQGMSKAHVWKDGHISYNHNEWIYEGEVADDRPQGKGVLKGADYRHRDECYEGQFQAGLCHGHGIFTSEKAGFTQRGNWKEGVFQEPNAASAPILLHAKYGRKSWSISSDGEWEWEEKDFNAELGSLSHYIGGLQIARIEQNCITLTRYDRTQLLTPGETVSFYEEVEGREWSDGCVYSGTDYELLLTWIK